MAADEGSDSEVPWEYSLRKYLMLLATLVATVTYTAGLSPPGGVWQETDIAGGHLAGDPIMRDTNHPRYALFFYLNAGAFASSLVVIVLILILSLLHEKKSDSLAPLHVLRGFMVLDLLTLIGAYTAGTYRQRDVSVYNLILAALAVIDVVVFHMLLPWCLKNKVPAGDVQNQKLRREREKARKVLMLLATFAVSVTYLAGLNAPGGFWDHAEGGNLPGDPVLMAGRQETRLNAFVYFNSTAFFSSLLIAVQLLDKNLRTEEKVRFRLLYLSIILALLGLVGAYSSGSTREKDTTIYGTLLVVAPLLITCITLVKLLLLNDTTSSKEEQDERNPRDVEPSKEEADDDNSDNARPSLEKARSLVLLLATLAATITYQAGLDPPGGLWEKDGVGHKAGDPILVTRSPGRYKAFFYCNSVAFVASLVAIVLVKKNLLLRYHALEAAMILDLFGLIGAYAAGSCRDVSTSIYAVALAGAVLVYVVIHVVFFTLDHDTSSGNNNSGNNMLEKRRKRLLLFAILAASITYQAGLTPPGGFRLQDDTFGHHAGDPVLLYNFPRRYNAFFYCNSVSFMLSIALILLLVNPNLYKPAIQSHALSVCTGAGMVSLVGAYAAGSTQHLRTSIKIFGLVAAILIIVVLVVLIFVLRSESSDAHSSKKMTRAWMITVKRDKKEQKIHSKRKYLMLLGILGASVTYQVGLKPPGGVWQSNSMGHLAGNPIMHDNGRTRYLAFFYINSTSFVASIIIIILLLPESQLMEKLRWSLRAMNTTIVLDLLGLLIAYAIGSSRSWKTTGYVFTLVIAVLVYIAIHVVLSYFIGRDDKNIAVTKKEEKNLPAGVASLSSEEANGGLKV